LLGAGSIFKFKTKGSDNDADFGKSSNIANKIRQGNGYKDQVVTAL
jgi:hypothetical protein